ncbi:glycosyltransferase family 2 protein [Rothia sp. ARF10]|nr:glycosyltransferase family 2 protein [Rothia sp. ARF10]
MAETTWVVTAVSGRHDHLREQRRVLAEVAPQAHHVVVSMGDPAIEGVVAEASRPPGRDVVRQVEPGPPLLPLSRARNLGVEMALSHGAALVVLLDVDCVPGPGLVGAYEQAARVCPRALLAGPVTYLAAGVAVPKDPADLADLRAPHAARPDPPAGSLVAGGDPDLFWSLSCAMTPQTWRLVGGFHEGYAGYGAEDTDFGRLARSRGVDLVWVGGADAFHQHHPVSSPPIEHLADIVRNARTFHDRWREWPMRGWLEEFRRRGLVRWEGEHLELTGRGRGLSPEGHG